MSDLTVFNKLVRDKVPALIAKSGDRAVLTVVSGEEELEAMRRKIVEEANELAAASDRSDIVSEIADLMEILSAYRKRLNIRDTEVFEAQNSKRRSHGAFDQGNLLISMSTESVGEMVRRLL